jgi:hypothetical protein
MVPLPSASTARIMSSTSSLLISISSISTACNAAPRVQ